MPSPADCDVMLVRSSGGSLLSLSFSLVSSSVLAQTAEEGGGTMGVGSVGSLAAHASILTGAGLSVVVCSDDTPVAGALVGALTVKRTAQWGLDSIP